MRRTIEKIKERKAITLIALVVTIVVLLILAGVSISLILDNNGIIKKSKDARKEYRQAQTNEQTELDNISDLIDEATVEIIEPENIADWEYTEEDDGTITINYYKGNDTTVIIPNYIEGKPVKKLASDEIDARGNKSPYSIWDKNICSDRWGYTFAQTTIKKVIISKGIETIGYSAFSCSYGLEQIVLPNSVTSIGYGAFYRCTALTSITIPNSVTAIEDNVFADIPSITVNVPFKEGKTPEGWKANWNDTSNENVVTINYAE